MTYLAIWFGLFLVLAMAGLCWEMWKACRAIVEESKPERKSLDRYY